jgi:hypothetical protein
MRHWVLLACVCALVVGGLMGVAVCGPTSGDDELAVQISPGTIAMNSRGGGVSAHANIACGLVVRESVQLNGIDASAVFADAVGDLVAKFPLDAVKQIVSAPETELTLTGVTTDGGSFALSDTVRVVE